MKVWYVMWVYCANYSTRPSVVQADTAEAALGSWLDASFFGADFRRRATIYVWPAAPTVVSKPEDRASEGK